MTLPVRALIAAGLLVPTAIFSGLAENRDLHTKVIVAESTLPEHVGAWESKLIPLTDSEKSMLDSPAASQRIYTDPTTGDQVQVLVLQVNNTQNAHDPKLCMAGSGFSLNDERVLQSPWASDAKSYPVSRAEFLKGDSRVTMYYWLQTPSGSVADMSSGLKLEGIKKALMGSSVKGVAIRVIALPNARQVNAPTDPKVAVDLWSNVSKQIHLDGLIAEM